MRAVLLAALLLVGCAPKDIETVYEAPESVLVHNNYSARVLVYAGNSMMADMPLHSTKTVKLPISAGHTEWKICKSRHSNCVDVDMRGFRHDLRHHHLVIANTFSPILVY